MCFTQGTAHWIIQCTLSDRYVRVRQPLTGADMHPDRDEQENNLSMLHDVGCRSKLWGTLSSLSTSMSDNLLKGIPCTELCVRLCLCEREPHQLNNETIYPICIYSAPRKPMIRCEHGLSGQQVMLLSFLEELGPGQKRRETLQSLFNTVASKHGSFARSPTFFFYFCFTQRLSLLFFFGGGCVTIGGCHDGTGCMLFPSSLYLL